MTKQANKHIIDLDIFINVFMMKFIHQKTKQKSHWNHSWRRSNIKTLP